MVEDARTDSGGKDGAWGEVREGDGAEILCIIISITISSLQKFGIL